MILYELILYKVCGLSFVLFFLPMDIQLLASSVLKKPILPRLSIFCSFVKNQLTVHVWIYLRLFYFVSLIYVFIPP